MLNREFYCTRWELPNVHVTSKHLSQNVIKKELRLSSCSNPISSKRTEASDYLGATFWVLNPPIFAWQTSNISTIQQLRSLWQWSKFCMNWFKSFWIMKSFALFLKYCFLPSRRFSTKKFTCRNAKRFLFSGPLRS